VANQVQLSPSTNAQNAEARMHLDWGGSQFLTKQIQVGVMSYVCEVGCDSGSGDRVGCSSRRWSVSARSSDSSSRSGTWLGPLQS